MFIRNHLCVCVCACVPCVHVCEHMCTCLCRTCVCVHVCMYVCTYVYLHTYVRVCANRVVQCLCALLLISLLPRQLPHQQFLPCFPLFPHHRVASCSDKNLMSESNLSIVFGPNLLKSRGSQSSIAALTDMTHQAKLVEIMIHHADKVRTCVCVCVCVWVWVWVCV